MSKLPSEILVSVIDRLSFDQKLNLAIACKRWYEAISQTTLYNKLVFRGLDKFNQAIDLCNQKQHLYQHVRALSIFDMKYDLQLSIALPYLFPNVTCLEWNGYDEVRRGTQTEVVNKSIYAQALKQWSNIESLIDYTQYCHSVTSIYSM